MMPTKLTAWLILVSAAALLLCLEQAQAQQVRWRHDYAAARKEAKEKGLPIIIDFERDA